MKALLSLVLLMFGVSAYAQELDIRKGNEYYKDGNFELAEMQYRKVSNGMARYNLANALIQQKKYKEALEVLETLASQEKNAGIKASAYYNAGVIFSRQKDLERSIEAYKNALRINPNDTDARENLQKALLEWKQQQKEKQSQQNKPSRMNKTEAERKLQELQDKERQLQQRLQGKQKGEAMEKDW